MNCYYGFSKHQLNIWFLFYRIDICIPLCLLCHHFCLCEVPQLQAEKGAQHIIQTIFRQQTQLKQAMLKKISKILVLLLFLTASIVFAQNESEIPIAKPETSVLQEYGEALAAPFSKAGEVMAVPFAYAGKMVVDMLSPSAAASDDTSVHFEAEKQETDMLMAKQLAVNQAASRK